MKNTKQLTETALLLALYMILFAITFFLPVFSIFLIWFLPLPFIVNAVRNGRNATIFMLVVALVLSIFFTLPAVPLTWTFASVGLVVGELYRRKGSAFHVLLGGTLTYIVNFLLLYILTIVFTGINPIADSLNAMKEMVNGFLTTPGLPEGSEEQMEALLTQLDFVNYLVPSMLIIGAILFAFVTQLLAGFILKRLGYEVNKWKPFHEWSLPKSLIFYYLIVLILVIVGLEEGTTLFLLVTNLHLILEYAMVLQGFTVIFAFSKMKRWNTAVPVLITVGSFLLMFPLQLVKLLGIFDLGMNLRSRMKFN